MYTALFNVLNFPSGAVPITKVTTEDIEKDMVNFPTKDMWHKAIKKVSYNPLLTSVMLIMF